MLPIEYWDEIYVLDEIANAAECENFERHVAAALTDGETLAKDICAFANAGGGILAYGLNDAGGLDAGISDSIGNQSVASWVAALIPKLHHPPIENCQVQFVPISNLGQGRGILAIHVPLSDRRPHWSIHGPREVPYLRVGVHSAAMRLQTLFDLSSRGSAPFGEIGELGTRLTSAMAAAGEVAIAIALKIRVASGPMCKDWGVELILSTPVSEADRFVPLSQKSPGFDLEQGHLLSFIRGEELLFPGKWTRIGRDLVLRKDVQEERHLSARLFLESAVPIHGHWLIVPSSSNVTGFDFIRETANPTPLLE